MCTLDRGLVVLSGDWEGGVLVAGGVDLGKDGIEGWQGQQTAHDTLIIPEQQEVEPGNDAYCQIQLEASKAEETRAFRHCCGRKNRVTAVGRNPTSPGVCGGSMLYSLNRLAQVKGLRDSQEEIGREGSVHPKR